MSAAAQVALDFSRPYVVDGPVLPPMVPRPRSRRYVVGFSGGVTSAWCAGWALQNFPREEVVLLFHDTKEEHPDTYRFLHEMAAALGLPITERSDGRSVSDVFEDEGFLGNNQNAMCSRILKMAQGDRYFDELRAAGHEPIKILGFSPRERERIQRATMRAESHGYGLRLPIVETGTTKQECADWCSCTMGVQPSAMYEHFDHANCEGCVKGGMAYWMKIREVAPAVFARRMAQEAEFGHGILRGGDREHYLLKDLPAATKRKVSPREKIDIGPCECGD